MSLPDLQSAFAQAWSDPDNLSLEAPPLDVNAVLADRYILAEPLAFTRTMLWDMEVRKARRPDLFIPSVVEKGSARAWVPEEWKCAGGDQFVRTSNQPDWDDPERVYRVIEQVHLDHDARKVTFIGVSEVEDDTGTLVEAGEGRPLFHVEHGTSGEEERPLNTWRWTFESPEDRGHLKALIEERAANGGRLPEYVEVYIRDVLGIGLEFNQPS
ncbi:hypothetical protein [Salininema proteolyticum]|uniref:Uncharacterized protein n=1 Tax=Salininema proteolyticum TaxID=1607685 RepID=A0ABV8U3P4_9ACTN